MFIKSDKIKGRVNEAVGGLTNDKFFKREGKIDQMPASVPKMLSWQVEPNGWDEV